MDMFDKINKIILDHKKKSNEVRKLKKKLKNKAKSRNGVPLSKLQHLLGIERAQTIDHRDYISWGEFDDSGYARENSRKDARIELLEELIKGN
jgi:hypothetical protein